MDTSVITITRNRNSHLLNLMLGLERSTVKVSELVCVVMGGDDPQRSDIRECSFSFPVNFVYLPDGGPLPLGLARNKGMEEAKNDFAIFLDVDCVPHMELISSYIKSANTYPDGVIMGEVNYLPEKFHLSELTRGSGEPHPGRHFTEEIQIQDYNLFWSLSFALTKKTFYKIGGFDETLTGYGGEDTDFAYSARKNAVPLYSCPEALAFHQYHPSYSPPLNHLNDILQNAEAFRRKWQAWPMSGWLDQFHNLGLINDYRRDNKLCLLRNPTDAELKSSLKV